MVVATGRHPTLAIVTTLATAILLAPVIAAHETHDPHAGQPALSVAGVQPGSPADAAGLQAGDAILSLDGCEIGASSDALRATYDEVARAAGEHFAESPIADHPIAGGVRRLFKSVGIDPSRYRPSGEALVRRAMALQGASSTQLSTLSYGEEKPANPGHDEYAWQQNRRVELVYH